MNKTLVVSLMSFIGIIIIIVICTIVQINSDKQEEIYNKTIKTITQASIECVKEKKCKNKKITLKELYNNKYLEKQINPKTKKEFNKNSYILYPELSFYVK